MNKIINKLLLLTIIISSMFIVKPVFAVNESPTGGTSKSPDVIQEISEEKNAERIVEAGIELDFVSRYVWRGIYYSDGPVGQPSAWISKWGLTGSVWANFVINNEHNQGKFNEVDLELSYENEFHNLTYKLLYIHYFYPNTSDPSTGELSLSLEYPIGPIKLFTSHFVDLKDTRGAYYGTFGIGFDHDIGEFFTFESSVSTAWASNKFNEYYIGVSKTASNLVAFDVALNCTPFSFMYVRPHMQYEIITDTELRNASGEPNLFTVGVAIGFEY